MYLIYSDNMADSLSAQLHFLFLSNLFSGSGDSLGLLMLSSQLIVHASLHHSSLAVIETSDKEDGALEMLPA